MATGDKPNSNLFGTNFNDDDKDKDKEKEAQLAAQNAMMGAGNIPASAFGQAPAINPFSMEAAGQVNPMMQPQSLEVTLQKPNPTTFLPYADDVATPPASALSVFTPGGEVKPNVDVNAITPSPEMTSTSAVNTALNQEVAVGSPSVENDPSFMSKVGSFFFPYGVGGVNRPTSELAQGEETQAPSGLLDLAATPSITTPAETPSEGAQEQTAALDSTSDAAILARRAQREAQFSPQGLMGQDATRAALGGMTLNEYLSAPAGTEGVSGLRTDPQGRMIPGSNTVGGPTTRAEAFPGYESEVAKAQARLSERDIRPGESQADRDTRIARDQSVVSGQAEGMSFDDAKRRAKGILAERNVQNPSASQVNALAISIQQGEPERLAELETKRAKDAADLREAEAKKDFKPQIVEIGDQKLIQLSPNYYQPVRPQPTAEEPFEPRVLEEGGFTYYETAPNRFERQPSTKTGGASGAVSSIIDETIAAGGKEVATPAPTVDTPEVATGDEFTLQQELGIQKVMADNKITRGKAIEELRKAGKLK